MRRDLLLDTPSGRLHGQLALPDKPKGLVLLPRPHRVEVDDAVGTTFQQNGYAVLAMELLSARETQFADATQDVARLTRRLTDILDLIRDDGDMERLPCAIHARDELVPAAVRVAAQRDRQVLALCVCDGLIDRAGVQALELLTAPLLMLFSAEEENSSAAWQRALKYLSCPLEAQRLAAEDNPAVPAVKWFAQRLPRPATS